MKEEKKLNLEKKPWLDELIGDRTQKIHFFVFLCVTIKFFNEISIPKTVLISASSVVIIYMVFHYGLKVIMPK